jgi:hypothetical protein
MSGVLEPPPARSRSRSRRGGENADASEPRPRQEGGASFTYRRTAGAFGLVVPVSTKTAMLGEEERTLSILRHIEQAVPVETRWYPVFRRYVDAIAARVAGMGGDPTQVVPTPDGDWRHIGYPGSVRAKAYHSVLAGLAGSRVFVNVWAYPVRGRGHRSPCPLRGRVACLGHLATEDEVGRRLAAVQQ